MLGSTHTHTHTHKTRSFLVFLQSRNSEVYVFIFSKFFTTKQVAHTFEQNRKSQNKQPTNKYSFSCICTYKHTQKYHRQSIPKDREF